MSITHASSVRASLAGVVKTAAEANGSAPKIVIKSSGGTALVTFNVTLGSVSAAAFSVSGTPVSASASATGDASGGTYELQDAAGNVVLTGAVGSDITVSPASITSGQTVNLTSYSYTAAL